MRVAVISATTRSSTIWNAWRVFRRCPEAAALALLSLAGASGTANAETAREPAACRTVRLADAGWTDVTVTTALLSVVLRKLGYEPHTTLLSVPVTFAVMKTGKIDVFLGNWMPAETRDRQPYIEDGSVEVVRENLAGAKYTLAVPAYLHLAGLRRFADIARFGPQLNYSIYGLEPGNDGNHHILALIQSNADGLGAFHLVESSEQGMLAQVERAFRARAPIVFLAWDPHPMNLQFDLRYLSGGEVAFGGGASVYTNTRAGYLAECPNVGRLLRNVQFTLKGESEVMDAILNRRQLPQSAAEVWLAAHPEVLAGWLEGVTTFDGRPALAAVRVTDRRAVGSSLESWISGHKIPVGDSVAVLIEYVKTHGKVFFGAVANILGGSVDRLTALLRAIPAPVLILGLGGLTSLLRRSIAPGVFVTAALLFIVNQGYWLPTLETLSLVVVAAVISIAIGVPLGIAAAHRPRLFAALRPVLDLMQTLPTFVYLIPTLVLFGLGVVPGLISTVVFALPAPIRMTQLGVSSVPKALLEVGEAFGATRWQRLCKVELPSAAPSIVAGVTQCIMLSLSMVVIAALVGAGGLGVPVVRALNTVQVGMGFEAGFVIVLLAIILDRMSAPPRGPGGPKRR
jgi:glycine betaine/proline transport system substrate-binding protein